MLTIRGVEVTQAIQAFRSDQHLTDAADRRPDNGLTLVANKPAWARVYVEATGSPILNVTGTLAVHYGILNQISGPPLNLTPQPPGQVTALVAPDYATVRGSIGQTLNFIIPAERMYGPLSLQVTVTGGGETAVYSLFISPTLRQTLKVRGIMIGYNGPDPANPSTTLTVAAPALADLQATGAWALRVMPVGSDAVFQVASTLTRTVALTGTASNGGCTAAWINLNAAIAAAKTADGNHPGFLYYGLLAATFPNTSNNGGCESSGVSSGFAGGQIAFTHEVGHACGRAHGPCGSVGTSADPSYPAYEPYDTPAARMASIGEFGLDISTGSVPTPNTARDYMSYCGPGWISIYGHDALLNRPELNPESVGTRDPWWKKYLAYDPWWWLHYQPDPPPYWIDPAALREFPGQMVKVIAVTGILHPDDRVEVTHVSRSEVASTALKGRATDLTVVLTGAKGAELASAPVVALRSQGCCGGEPGGAPGPQPPVLFQAFLADVAPGTALSIRRGKKVLWNRPATAAKLEVGAPKVDRAEEGKVFVSWTVRGPKAPAVDAWLRVSDDEGRTWRAVATGLTTNQVVVEADHLPAGDVLLQVVVHDGFRSVPSPAAAFKNRSCAPSPAILHPQARPPLVAGETLHLWGSVAPQPGQEPGSPRYQWSLDGKAVGDTLQVFTTVPEPGKHRCELAVVDAKGKALRRSTVEFTSIAPEETKA